MIITDMNGGLSGYKSKKIRSEYAGKERSHGRTASERKHCPVSQTATAVLLSHQQGQSIYHTSFFFDLKPGYFSHQEVAITIVKTHKNIKEREHFPFERLKPEHNQCMFFSISSVK